MSKLIDLTGQTFERLTVISRGKNKGKYKRVHWNCICSCGKNTTVQTSKLTTGHTKSCGCLMRESAKLHIFIDIAGKVFNRLTVISQASNKNTRVRWNCICDCGEHVIVDGNSLRNNHTKSCGCLSRESAVARFTKHGACGTKTYRIWQAMLSRCNNPTIRGFHRYGGRGIKVCLPWKTFENFHNDMGDCPPKHSIERIDNEKGYSPENCEWSTAKEQANNRCTNTPITLNGLTLNIGEWSTKTGISPTTIRTRITHLGWSIEKALTTPVRKHN